MSGHRDSSMFESTLEPTPRLTHTSKLPSCPDLTEHQTMRLGALERLNLKINRAYLLNELFRAFWAYRRAGWATRYLTRWFWWATHSRLAPMRDFAWDA